MFVIHNFLKFEIFYTKLALPEKVLKNIISSRVFKKPLE